MKNLIPALICLFLAIPCQAGTIFVDANGMGDYPTIQAAIDDSTEGDIIVLQPGTYTGDGNRDIHFLGKAITVRSVAPNDPNIVAATIIDCNGIETEGHRGFNFNNSEDANSVLAGLTITNGYAYMGGAILCYYSSPTITNCIISENIAIDEGGAISGWWDNEFPTISNCTISGNTGHGAVYDCDGPITNCTISNNSWGGLVDCDGTISECTISGNSVWGGVLFSNGRIINCTITGNSANSMGGGLAFCEGQVINCVISGNISGDRGGGIYCMNHSVQVINCTITGNSAEQGGGIFAWRNSRPKITNSVLWDNSPEEIYVINDTPVITYSDVQGSWPGLGNIDVDPCFVEPGYWDPNGTPSDTNDDFWVDGDYHLKSEGWRWTEELIHDSHWYYDFTTSRCIDAGNPGSPLADELMTVPDDPCNIWGENIRINMGAYGGTAEASMPPYDWVLLSDITNDGTVDFVDFAHVADMFTNQDDELPGDFDRDGDVDYTDLFLLTEDWLGETIWHE